MRTLSIGMLADGDEGQYGVYGQVSDPAKRDTDGDGQDDAEECVAASDPGNPDSFFQCLEIFGTIFPNLGKVLSWPSAAGRVYGVSASSNLLTSDFWPLTSGLPATPPENAWTDTVTGAEEEFFYRIDAKRTP